MSGNDQRSYNKRTWKCSFQREQLGSKLLCFYFLNLQQTTTKSISLSQTSPIFFFFSCALLSLDVEPSKMPRTPRPTLSVVTPVEYPHPKFLKPSSHSLWNAFYTSLTPSTSAPPHFSSPSALESLTISLGTLAYSTPPLVTRWATAPHKSTIAYSSRIHMDLGWVAINPQIG